MELIEIKRDLFTMPDSYYLAHCISADAKMGAGIAVQFKKRFKLSSLQTMGSQDQLEVGKCYLVDRVMNLVTKPKYWNKPTYDSLTSSIRSMKKLCLQNEITQLAMPEIGCGLDKLQWGAVRDILKREFEDTAINITVCRI